MMEWLWREVGSREMLFLFMFVLDHLVPAADVSSLTASPPPDFSGTHTSSASGMRGFCLWRVLSWLSRRKRAP